MSEIRHLHRDYHTTFCGLDASYIPMTYDPDEHDCAKCAKAHAAHVAEVEKQQAELEEARVRDEEARAKEAEERAKAEAEELAAIGLKFGGRDQGGVNGRA